MSDPQLITLTLEQLANIIAIPNDTGDKDYVGEVIIKVWTSMLGDDCFERLDVINGSLYAIPEDQWKLISAHIAANVTLGHSVQFLLDWVSVGPSIYHGDMS